MSNTDVTQPTPPTWQPTPVQPPARKRRPSKKLVAVLLAVLVAVAAIVTLIVTTVQQHGKAVDARSTLADTRADLKGTQSSLAKTKDDLSSTQASLDGTTATLATTQSQLREAQDDIDVYSGWVDDCQPSAKVGRLLVGVAVDLLDGTDRNINTAIAGLEAATAKMDKVNDIIDANGYSTIYELFDACDLEGTGANA